MRRIILWLLVLLAAGLGFIFALLSPVKSRAPYAVNFVVLPGESLADVSNNLHTLGLIRERHAFEILVRVRGQARSLKAGPYRASSDEWAWEILGRLVRGDVQDTSVTVPEGLWVVEVAELVAPMVEGGADSFLAVAGDSVLLAKLGIPGGAAEGYLFPDTYRLIPSGPAEPLVRQMVRNFFRVWKEALEDRAEEVGMSLEEVVTLASIVEAEAQIAEERPRIAAVYLNRLARGLPLQADPTVHYALGERRTRTLYQDLEHPSPYNTYRHQGLPPGPICNPGLSALRAVLWPLENCEDLFFVALGDGRHLFAPDFAGHLKNRRRVRQERSKQGSP